MERESIQMKAYVTFQGSQRIASINAVGAIIEKHRLRPQLDGTYRFTAEMVTEAQQLDEALRGAGDGVGSA